MMPQRVLGLLPLCTYLSKSTFSCAIISALLCTPRRRGGLGSHPGLAGALAMLMLTIMCSLRILLPSLGISRKKGERTSATPSSTHGRALLRMRIKCGLCDDETRLSPISKRCSPSFELDESRYVEN